MESSWFEIIALGGLTFLASTMGAVAGFGSAIVLLPAIVAVFGARDAIPILTFAQIVGNCGRVWFNREEIDTSILKWFALGAVPLALIGGFLFSKMSIPFLTRGLGVFLVLNIVWRHWKKSPLIRPTKKGFTIIGAFFGFLSAILGSTGPVMAPIFLSYGLVKGAYIGTEAAAALIMHITKIVAYGSASLLGTEVIVAGILLGPCMLAGAWFGKRILLRLPEKAFLITLEVVIFFSGVHLILKA